MSAKLTAIAARYAAGMKAAAQLAPLSDERRLNALRAVKRYGLVWNCLLTLIPHGHKTREEMTDDEWRSFIAWCVEFFNANLRDFGTEEGCVSYIRFQMRYLLAGLGLAHSTAGVWRDVIDESEIPKVIAWFVSLPDAAEYGYKP